MKIAVIAGGTSSERLISISSGTEVALALKSKGHNVYLMDMFYGCSDEEAETAFEIESDIIKTSNQMKKNTEKIEAETEKRRQLVGENIISVCGKADSVFLALHGSNGEDGRLQAMFDLYGIKYSGTDYLSSAIAMDKSLTKQFFQLNEIPTPLGALLNKYEKNKSYTMLGLKLPIVVKPCCGGSSLGVSIVNTDGEYEKAIQEAFLYEDRVIVEEFIPGREFSVAVVDDEAYPIIELAPKEGFYDYKNKYSDGMTIETCPAELSKLETEKMQRLALAGARALMISGYCRLDFIMSEDGEMYCLEANTLPGMTPTSLIPKEAAAMGIEFPDLCEKLLGL